jgi:serine/threonine protein kinase
MQWLEDRARTQKMLNYKQEDLSGHRIGGCLLEYLIGQGGMSSVYLARQIQPARKVALKLLKLEPQTYNEHSRLLLQRFKREADIVANLSHDNIIDIYACGEEGQYAYLIMPYFKGGSLGDLIARQGTLTLKQATHYLRQASAGLDHAHANGIIHRDLKPENFLLSPDLSRLVIADFGIARITSPQNGQYHPALTQDGMIFGTCEYMAPENFLSNTTVDHRADIYALGIVLYQMLSGTLPFEGDTITVIEHHLHDPLPSLSQNRVDIPYQVDHVLQKATHKDPAYRYNSASEVAQAFEQALQSFSSYKKSLTPLPRPYPYLAPTTPPTYYAPTRQANTILPTQAQPTHAVQPVQRTKRRAQKRTISYGIARLVPLLSLLIVILILITAAHIAAQPAPSTSAPQHTPLLTATAFSKHQEGQEANRTIQRYYIYLNDHDYKRAYSLNDPALQSRRSYTTFVTGYQATQHDAIQVTNTSVVSPTRVLITVRIQATEERSSHTVENTYIAHYTLLLQNNNWLIDSEQDTTLTHNQ